MPTRTGEISPRCIFCLRVDVPRSEEHIFPEGLVGKRSWNGTGPAAAEVLPELVLDRGEVCRDCNSDLSKLDGSLVEALGLLRVYWNETGTKRGTPASTLRPGLYAVRNPDGPHLVINAESHAVRIEDGSVSVPAAKGPNSFTVREEERNGELLFHCMQPITVGKRFVRAVHKIAFETLCLRKGYTFVLDPQFNDLRKYILWGKGSRHCCILPGDIRPETPSPPPLPSVEIERAAGTASWCARVLLGFPILVDLTPSLTFPWTQPLRIASDRKPQRVKMTFTIRASNIET